VHSPTPTCSRDWPPTSPGYTTINQIVVVSRREGGCRREDKGEIEERKKRTHRPLVGVALNKEDEKINKLMTVIRVYSEPNQD
jgi:hypothetical protein